MSQPQRKVALIMLYSSARNRFLLTADRLFGEHDCGHPEVFEAPYLAEDLFGHEQALPIRPHAAFHQAFPQPLHLDRVLRGPCTRPKACSFPSVAISRGAMM